MVPRYFNYFDGATYKVLTARQFQEFAKKNKLIAKNAIFIPPRIGSNGFGKFYIREGYVSSPKIFKSATEIWL